MRLPLESLLGSVFLLIFCCASFGEGIYDNNTLRVGVSVWAGYDLPINVSCEAIEENLISDLNPEKKLCRSVKETARAVSFVIAAEIFNTRNVTLLPSLGSAQIQACPFNISVVKICDDIGQAMVAVRNFEELLEAQGVHAYVGMEENKLAASVSQIGATFSDAVFISTWAGSATFDDRKSFPRFARVYDSDSYLPILITSLFEEFSYSFVSMLFMKEDSGSEIAAGLISSIENVVAYPFSREQLYVQNYDALRTSLGFIKRANRNVLILVTYTEFLYVLAEEFAHAGLLENENRIFVFVYLDDVVDVEYTTENENYRNFLLGSFHLVPATPTEYEGTFNTLLDEHWGKFYNQFGSKVNQALPNGGGTKNLSCINTARNWTIDPSFFDDTKSAGKDPLANFANSMDSVLALGFAICSNTSATEPLQVGEALFARLKNVSFIGFSGLIEFDERGDRKHSTIGYRLINYATPLDEGDPLEQRTVGEWLVNATWVIDGANMMEFASGAVGLSDAPDQIDIPYHERNDVPIILVNLAFLELAFLTLACLFCAGWLIAHRNNQKVFHYDISVAIAIVCLTSSWMVLGLTVNDSNPSFSMDVACMLTPVLSLLGLNLYAILEAFKFHLVFSVQSTARKLKLEKKNEEIVFFLVVFVCVVNILLLFIWCGTFPFQWKRTVLFRDFNNFVTESVGECNGGSVGGVYFLLVIALLTLIALFLLRNLGRFHYYLPQMHWCDLPYHYTCVVNVFRIACLSFPTIIAVNNSPAGRFVVQSMVSLLIVCTILVCLVISRIIDVHFGRDLFEYGESSDSGGKITSPLTPLGGGINMGSAARGGGINMGSAGGMDTSSKRKNN